jgi:hypothetical protein
VLEGGGDSPRDAEKLFGLKPVGTSLGRLSIVGGLPLVGHELLILAAFAT